MAWDYDVFLSHNSRDKPTVQDIGERLRARGLRVWLDKWELQPGLRWQEELEQAILTSGAVAVFISQEGLGPWEKSEMRAFMDRSTREELRVIPVLLRGAPPQPELPLFLSALRARHRQSGLGNHG